MKMDNLNLITSDFTFSGNFDGCLPQKVGVSAPVLKRNDPVGTVHGGKNGGIGCIAGQKRTDFSSALPVNGNPAYQGRAYFAMAALITDIRLIKLSL